MTGDQSRLLKVGARVCWVKSATDHGTVDEVDWSSVKIVWDDGHTSSVAAKVEAPGTAPGSARSQMFAKPTPKKSRALKKSPIPLRAYASSKAAKKPRKKIAKKKKATR